MFLVLFQPLLQNLDIQFGLKTYNNLSFFTTIFYLKNCLSKKDVFNPLKPDSFNYICKPF